MSVQVKDIVTETPKLSSQRERAKLQDWLNQQSFMPLKKNKCPEKPQRMIAELFPWLKKQLYST